MDQDGKNVVRKQFAAKVAGHGGIAGRLGQCSRGPLHPDIGADLGERGTQRRGSLPRQSLGNYARGGRDKRLDSTTLEREPFELHALTENLHHPARVEPGGSKRECELAAVPVRSLDWYGGLLRAGRFWWRRVCLV